MEVRDKRNLLTETQNRLINQKKIKLEKKTNPKEKCMLYLLNWYHHISIQNFCFCSTFFISFKKKYFFLTVSYTQTKHTDNYTSVIKISVP